MRQLAAWRLRARVLVVAACCCQQGSTEQSSLCGSVVSGFSDP